MRTRTRTQFTPAVLNRHSINALKRSDPETGDPIPDADIDPLAVLTAQLEAGAKQLLTLRDAILADLTSTEGARELRVRDAAKRFGQAAADRVDAARTKLNAEIANIRTATLPKPPADLNEAREIRALFAAIRSDAERGRILDGACERGDSSLLSALLATPLMSSADRRMIDLGALGWRLHHHAPELERQHRLERALEDLQLKDDAVFNFCRDVGAAPLAQEAEAAAAAVKNAESLFAAALASDSGKKAAAA